MGWTPTNQKFFEAENKILALKATHTLTFAGFVSYVVYQNKDYLKTKFQNFFNKIKKGITNIKDIIQK